MNYEKWLNIGALLFGIFLLIAGTENFWKGFHNMDAVYNSCVQVNDRCKNGELIDFRSMTDYTAESRNVRLVDVYTSGYNKMKGTIFALGFGGLLLGISIRGLFNDDKKDIGPSGKVRD